LEQTIAGIHLLRKVFPNTEFLDATEGPRHLSLPQVNVESLVEQRLHEGGKSMAKKTESPIKQDEHVPTGYGKLISVTHVGTKDAVLWFEDMSGTIRAVRMGIDISKGFALEMKGQAQVVRS
jgi:hypothetical protein